MVSARAMRVGPWLEPIGNMRSPLTVSCQLRMRISRNAVRSRRSSLGTPPTSTRTSTSHCGWSPSRQGHQRGGWSTSTVSVRVLSPAASIMSWVTAASVVPSGPVTLANSRAGSGVSRLRATVERHLEEEPATRLGRLAAQGTEPLDAHRAGVAQPDRTPDAARVPLRVEVVPVGEDPGDRALRGAVPLGRARHLDREQVAVVGWIGGPAR